jgi:hypothetical protein
LTTDIAVDEMMLKFKGRSKDTICLREKHKRRYKVFALSEHGYMWGFLLFKEEHTEHVRRVLDKLQAWIVNSHVDLATWNDIYWMDKKGIMR